MVNTTYDFEVAIIGGGLAGLSAAIEADKHGLKTVIFEKGLLGGLAFNGGDIILNHIFRRLAANFGGNLDIKKDIMAELNQKSAHYVREYTSFLKDNANVTLILEEARVTSPHVIRSITQEVTAKNIILAYGADVKLPTFKGLGEGRQSGFIKTSKEMLNHTFTEQSIVIYGGGKIAVEFADFLANIKINTYVLARSTFLKDLDDDARTAYFNLIDNPYLHLITGAEITSKRTLALFTTPA